ncbi:MAG: zinc-ribbon domain-containing protein [Clostridia bacterium]|nr:zinc-ribbon domain-containing protein [Clostridia bacterium]
MENRFCTNCGSRITDDSAFCGECGMRLISDTQSSDTSASAPKTDPVSSTPAPVQSAPAQRSFSEQAQGFLNRFTTSICFAIASIAFALPILFELIKTFVVISEKGAYAIVSNTSLGIFLCVFCMFTSLAGIITSGIDSKKNPSLAKLSKIFCIIALAYAIFFLTVLSLFSLIGTASAMDYIL